MSNPYAHLSADKFWRSAVATKPVDALYNQLWQPKFPIDTSAKILTAGSCFAQHVGRWLAENGFNFTPSTLAPEHNFSFATGNIYTPALLRQWLEALHGARDLSGIYAETGGRYYDLLRPAIQAEGYETLDALLEDRAAAMAEMRAGLESAQLFVFTLGLTEAWTHKDGTVYPMCPGTLCGTFDPEAHVFRNFDHASTLAEMTEVIRLVKALNPDIKFLLTVSPVPLTATADNSHVLTSTIYSKAVLRSCAGELAKTHEDVDYFPSYELISAHPSKGAFFEDNLRSVKPEGVAFVMSHLNAGLNGYPEAAPAAGPTPTRAPAKDENEICEDLFLETLNTATPSAKHPKFCLFGDSHMALISKSMTRSNVAHIGGMIMKGAAWAESQFVPDATDFVIPLENRASRTLWLKTLEDLERIAAEGGEKPVILTNVGMHTRAFGNAFVRWLQSNNMMGNIEPGKCVKFFGDHVSKHITVLTSLVEAGYRVVLLSDPPIQRYYDKGSEIEPFIDFYERLYGQIMASAGARVFNAREWVANEAGYDEAYCSTEIFADGERDWMHGSALYYDKLVAKLDGMTFN